MLLSQLFQKPVFTGKMPRGVVVGVAFSPKTYVVKQLLCAHATPTRIPSKPDFAVNVSAISAIADEISLTRVRPVLPQRQHVLSSQLPVYSHDGVLLGRLTDGEMENFVLRRLYTDLGNAFSPADVAVCRDAVILRKEQPYPIGQRVPYAILSLLNVQDRTVSKPLLQRAMQQGKLVRLTLSLPPFAPCSPYADGTIPPHTSRQASSTSQTDR